jgi:cytochrome c-type biogenesis protein CcmF
MNEIGEFALMIALATSLYGCVTYVMAARGNRVDLYLSAEKIPFILCACVIVASAALLRGLLMDDFSLQYVWAYSNRDLDTFYKISSFWGGQKGSLLFWTLLLTCYTLVVHIQNRKRNAMVVPYAMVVLMTITTFFLVLLNFSTNPFEVIPVPPEDGRGLNPLLRFPLRLRWRHSSVKIWMTAGFVLRENGLWCPGSSFAWAICSARNGPILNWAGVVIGPGIR